MNRACWMSVALLASSVGVVAAQETLDRTMLPIAEPKPPTYDELDARDAKAPARFEVKAPRKRLECPARPNGKNLR